MLAASQKAFGCSASPYYPAVLSSFSTTIVKILKDHLSVLPESDF
jgi:hypothetical protein